jgi:hypothetical protein
MKPLKEGHGRYGYGDQTGQAASHILIININMKRYLFDKNKKARIS